MDGKVLLGRGKQILEISETMWKQHLEHTPEHSHERLSFMTEQHQQIRYFVVRELMNTGKPLSPGFIAERLGIPPERVKAILDELEKNLFFLARDEKGEVVWAYPVTVEPTPHRLFFSTGERLYGAWAEDALAAPFVEGKLRNEYLMAEVHSECKHCGQALHITVDSSMHVTVCEGDAAPWVFMPDMDWEHFSERTIIDAYWRNTVFFWSEEHAREYRINTNQVDGMYLTLAQCAFMTPIVQGGLFGF
jgi:hypothetical protein